MANISYLQQRLRHMDHPDLDDPYHPFFFSNNNNPQNDDGFSDPESVIISAPDLLDHRDNQVSFVIDLLQDRVEHSPPRVNPSRYDDSSFMASGFGVIDHVDEDVDEVELGLGLEDESLGFLSGAARVVGFGSDSDSEVGGDPHPDPGEEVYYFSGGGYEVEEESVEVPIRWDSLRLDDNDEDFGWEEVDARLEERDILSVFVGEEVEEEENDEEEDGEASVSLSISPTVSPEDLVSVGESGGGVMGNVEWEVLLNAGSLDLGPDHEVDFRLEPYFGENGNEYVDTAEYETLFGQFVESESVLMMGKPPAGKAAIEGLVSVVVMGEDICAVCKDEIVVGEMAKQLPCAHRYHGECIVPWLGIRNTCPVCRHELPTDDMEYERRKVAAQRRG